MLMIRKLFSGGLKKIFLFLVILCILAIIAIGVYSINKASDLIFERTEANSLLKMQEASEKIDSIVYAVDRVVYSVSENMENILSAGSDEERNDFFAEIITDERIEACFLRMADGVFLYNPKNIPIDVIQIQIHAGTGGAKNSEAYKIIPMSNVMPYGAYHIINTYISVPDSGEKTAMYLFVSSEMFDELMYNLEDNNNLVVIQNENGSAVSISDQERFYDINSTNLMFKMHDTDADVFEFQKYAERQIIARYISKNTGISIFMIYDKGDFYHEVYRIWYVVISFVIVFVSLIIFIYYLLKKQYLIPLNLLVDKMKSTENELINEELTVKGGDEINLIINQFNEMQKSIREMLAEVSYKEEQKRQMEMRALRYQINPHFLYNTVSNMRILAISRGETEIGDHLSKLSQMYKYIFSTKENFVTIQSELEFIKNYISLMNVRYENRINTFFLLDEALNECLIPVFLLQPIVENAILHGLSKKLNSGEECLMRIEIKSVGEKLKICVFDNGSGMSEEQVRSWNEFDNSIQKDRGLFNTVSRLNNLYKGNYKFNIKSEIGSFTEIMVEIPYDRI